MNIQERNSLLNNIIAINTIKYYDLQTFADLTNRSAQAIRLLIAKGNRLRKLKHLKLGRMLLIEIQELTEFPFSCAGRSKLVIKYDEHAIEYTQVIQ